MKRLKRMLSMLLVCCMVFTCLPITAKAATESNKGGIYDGEVTTFAVVNFYEAVGTSKNENFKIRGVAIDASGIAWCILASTQAGADKHGFMTASINGINTVTDPHYKAVTAKNKPAELTLVFPDEATEIIKAQSGDFSGQELYIIEIGKLADLTPEFVLNIDSHDNGWDIVVDNPAVKIEMNYDITKLVNGQKDIEYVELPDKRILTYTVRIKNNGDHPVYGINVYDILPKYLSIKSVTAQVLAPVAEEIKTIDPMYDMQTRKLSLDTNISMPVGFEKEYTIITEVSEDYKEGTIVNTATIEGPAVLEDEAQVKVFNDFFYVHHIYNDGVEGHENGVEMRIDRVKINEALRDGAKFDVTTVNSAGTGYKGMLEDTLYGGTFNKTEENGVITYTVPYDFDPGENGIGFKPEKDKHYYIWEPTNRYLRPNNLAVWHTHRNAADIGYHTIAGYPVSVVDRVNYKQFGFVRDGDFVSEKMIYNKITATQNFDNAATNTLTAQNFKLTGFLGCYKFDDSLFAATNNKVTFQPYWITLDGVQVTGIKQRTAEYKGIGPNDDFKKFGIEDAGNTYPVETYKGSGNQTLMVSAMFKDSNLAHPVIPEQPAPETVDVIFEKITTGASKNIKALKLTFDLSEFDYDRAWFEINGELIEAQDVGGVISAKISQMGTELNIVPHWSYGDEEFSGATLVLNVAKNSVKDVTPVVVSRMSVAPFRTSMSPDVNNSGVILQ